MAKSNKTKAASTALEAYDSTGKCKKAVQSLNAVRQRIQDVREQLDLAQGELLLITGAKAANPTERRITLNGENLPSDDVDLYIDFALTVDEDDVEGAIVYGVLRDPAYPHYLRELTGSKKKEERPLAAFSVDDQGKISIKGKLEDEWWLSDIGENKEKNDDNRKKVVSEMHYRALNLIWRDALNWVNEPRLP